VVRQAMLNETVGVVFPRFTIVWMNLKPRGIRSHVPPDVLVLVPAQNPQHRHWHVVTQGHLGAALGEAINHL
jgi:hypothetical protein